VIFAPHVKWLLDNEFPTVTYALARAQGRDRAIDHFFHPLEFATHQFLALVPMVILLRILISKSDWTRPDFTLTGFPHAFVFCAAFGAFLAFLLTSAATGLRLLNMWGTPLWSFIGVFILSSWNPPITADGLRRFSYAFVGLAMIWVLAFAVPLSLGPGLTGLPKRGHVPGQTMADYVSARWEEKHGRPLPIVGGDRSLAENIGFYARSRPDVYVELNATISPWTSDEDLKARGGVIVWNVETEGTRVPDRWRNRFPQAEVQPVASFAWQTSAHLPPLLLGWAAIPPGALRQIKAPAETETMFLSAAGRR
jgi:hypothetical protein